MAAAAQRQAGMQGQPGMANGVNPQQRTGTPNNNGNVAPAMANSSSQPGHPPPNPNLAARQHPGQQQQQQAVQTNYPNGNMSGMPLNNTGVPQAQMQATMQNTQRMGPPMAMQRSQFPNTQQHQFQLQQQQINMASNLTANMGMTNGMPNANMMGSMAGQNTNGNMNATMNGSMNGNLNGSMNGMSNNAGSPRLNQVNPQMHNQQSRPLSSGHMPQLLQIQNSLKTSHPEWTSEQVQKMASDQLQRYMAKQRQQAMSAASGSSTGMNSSPQVGNNHYISNGQMQNSPSPNAVQNYQNQLLAQQRMIMQQQRQNAGSPGMNGARPVSRSATPQNPQQLGLQSPSSQPPRTQ
jgi:chromatin modification-related protein VID21